MASNSTSKNMPKMVFRILWIPMGGFLFLLLNSVGGMRGLDAAVIAYPVCLFGQFMLIAAKYSCKSSPIERTNTLRLLGTHILASVIMGVLWYSLARTLIYAISFGPQLQGLDQRFSGKGALVFLDGIAFYWLSVFYYYVVFARENAMKAEARMMETTMLARDAELKALKAQLNPHFLFNSLNSISALTSIDPARAREMCILLADFLRITLRVGENPVIPFSEELGLLERFLSIEKVRFGTRLSTEEAIEEDARNCLLPPLLLQPLIENAVARGIANLPEGGTVRIAARCSNGRMIVTIDNSFDPDAPPRKGNGMGLRNVRERLEARYGKEASLRTSAEGERFEATVVLPAEREVAR
ncbi:MAG: histidine kinase [Acidobacteria bacterium]|nr:histidine kinase [Acidobacteriota bacterium]MBS1867665.1 histidine kinase [Acidobacteriota bacterium]